MDKKTELLLQEILYLSNIEYHYSAKEMQNALEIINKKISEQYPEIEESEIEEDFS